MIAKKCDRCGNFYEPGVKGIELTEQWWRYEIHKDYHPYPAEKIDLCLDCRKKLYKWIQEGKR